MRSRKRMYWERVFAAERENEMKRAAIIAEDLIASADRNAQYVVNKQFNSAGKVYPRGCSVSVEELGQAFDVLVRNAFIVQRHGAASAIKPRDLPAPSPPKTFTVEIVPDKDPYASWVASVKATMEKNGISEARARNLLTDTSKAGRDLYLIAQRVGCQAEAKRRNVQSVSPDMVRYL